MATVDILLPTHNRLPSLILTLAGIAEQSLTDLRVIIADQSDPPAEREPEVQMLARLIAARGGAVEWHHRDAGRGVAAQCDFLLGQATADTVLYLDDDVFMEPWVVARLRKTLRHDGCGFIGAFPCGLSECADGSGPDCGVAYWEGSVRPEVISPGTEEWARAQLHQADHLYTVSRRLPAGESRRYKVAWVSSCVMYDRAKLLEVGGFSFWPRLGPDAAAPEMLVQNLLMRRWGGCAILPSGTYYAQAAVPARVPAQPRREDGRELLPELIAEYAPSPPIPSWAW